jgi:hypothetical protein
MEFLLLPIMAEASNPPMTFPDKPPSSYAGLERRHFPRCTVQVPIDILPEGSDAILATTTTDLSRNGCYVRLPQPLSVGHRLQATLWLDGIRVEVGGRVVTRHPDFGNGIMFLQIPHRAEQALASYMEAVLAE